MCGGVIVITATIAACTMIIDASPSCTIRDRRITTHDRLTDLIGWARAADRVDAADDRQRVGAQADTR